MEATMSVAAVSSSLNYTSKSMQVRTANGYAKVQEESLSVAVRADSVSLSVGNSLVDPKSKAVDLKALLASSAEDSQQTDGVGADLTNLQKAMKDQIIEQMKQAQATLKASGQDSKLIDDILYAVDKDQKAADVPEKWGADQTSQRIVDFAAAFKGSAKGMSNETFLDSIRKAVQDGFRQAKNGLENVPAAAAKLFNDTYESTMKKLDDLLASWQKEEQDGSKDATADSGKVDDSAPVTGQEDLDTDTTGKIPEAVANGQIQPAPVQTPVSRSNSTFSILA